jgi:elongation factor Ts
VEISTEMVKELRERTGAGILDSKKALQETQGNMDRAIEILRERGLARAAKKVGREAKEGLIEAMVDDQARKGVLVEVNCETDFVARTPDFKALAHQVALQVADANPPYGKPEDLPSNPEMQAAIVKLGENIQVRRFVRYELNGKPGLVDTYTHAGGRVAVMIEVGAENGADTQSPEFKALAHDLALQVAAANPRYLRSEDVAPAVLESERNFYRTQLAEEKKPANIIDRIVEGKLQKFYEEACLLNQPYIRDDKVKVKDLIQQTGRKLSGPIQVRRFVRYELGD